MRYALKISYYGGGFRGYQRQPRGRTVEGEIIEVLRSHDIIEGARRSRFESASRTDKGVSALGNVISFDSQHDPREIASILNTSLQDIWSYAYADVPDSFKPRYASERWYRYWFSRSLEGVDRESIAHLFMGKHDFGAFSKAGVSGVCDVREFRLRDIRDATVLDIRANRFLWNMVRRIAGCIDMMAEGKVSEGDIRKALNGDPLPPRLAPAEGLWLMDVIYDFSFQPLTSHVKEKVMETREERERQGKFLEELLKRLEGD